MAQQQQATLNSNSAPGANAAINVSVATSSTNTSLYPVLESSIAPLEDNETNSAIVHFERELVTCLRNLMPNGNLLDDIADKSILPVELFSATKKIFKPRLDPLKRLKDLPVEEAEEEEEQDDEEDDEEQEIVEDEEDDAGGDYLVSHFDNGENYEDNDDECDDMSGMM